jgi:hypothetical protein
MGPVIRSTLMGFVLLCAGPLCVHGQRHSDGPPTVPPPPATTIPGSQIPRVHRAPKLDDFLNGRPREAELAVSDFRQYQPGDGVPGSEPTTAYLSYDDKNLYVAFICHDEPGAVRAHLSKREDIDQDDGVGIYLDTFRDAHRAYFFFSNPVGVQADAIYTEGYGADFSFDTLWDNSAHLTKDGYVAFFSIPFKSMRFSHDSEQTWGVALYRVILRKNEYLYWPYITQRVQGITQQFAPVSGLNEISPGHNLQFIPYGLLASDHFLNQAQTPFVNFPPAFDDRFEHRAGLDAKFVVKDALTFDVTLNPDFSQVESDDPQVTINQRFAVFFPEKRPFFIENAGFFQTPIDLFFSRQVADPQFGARMTGKIGKWTLGTFLIDDRQPGLNQPAGSPFHTRAADGVFRVTREFGTQSYVGAFFSSRDFADTSNRVASLDARIKFSPSLVLYAQTSHSWTRQDSRLFPSCLTEDHLNSNGIGSQQGNASLLQLDYLTRHWAASTVYDDISPDFCAELGFIPRTDVRRLQQVLDYFWRPDSGHIVDFGPLTRGLVNFNRQGKIQDWEADLGFQIDWTGQTSLSVTRAEAFELFNNIPFRKHATAFNFSTAPKKWFSLRSSFSTGIGEDFFPGQPNPALPPLTPFLGNTKRLSLGFTLRPSSRLRFDQTYIYSRLGTRDGSTPTGFTPGQSIFDNHLLRSKLNYQFTREFSLRLILDYNGTLANRDLIDLQPNLGSYDGGPIVPTKQFTTDILFTYLLHPGTAVYVGYNNGFNNLSLDRTFVPPQVFNTNPSVASTSRLFFVKLSYLFRY